MEEEFVSSVSKALELVRKRDNLRLGKHEIARLTLVQRQAQPSDPPTRLGRIVTEILGELLDAAMRPDSPTDLDRVDWRRFVLLEQYVFRTRTMGEIMDDLGISQATFFETKRDAIEMLANELWLADQRATQEMRRIPQNIPAPDFDFIPRVDHKGRDLIGVILNGLQKRPWVVSIRGFGGVGKSTLAIEAAWAAVKRGLFNRVAWVSIRPDQAESPELLGDILDTIGKSLGSRNVLAVDDLEERRRLVLELLLDGKSLVVIDSTERVPDDQHEQIVQLVRDLPLPTCAIIVSREMHRKTELETMIELEGMQHSEALRFLMARADDMSIQLSDEEASYLSRVTRGNPRAMVLALGWMRKYGMPAEDVLDPRLREMSELLDHLLGRLYEKLDQDEERVLNVMPLFAEPVEWPPIAAAVGLGTKGAKVRAALGNLHSRFLVDVDKRMRYNIAPLVRMFLRDRAEATGARTVDQAAREFWAAAYERLIDHCVDEFKKASPQKRLEYARDYRQTVLDELHWASDHGHHQRLTDLMFYVGGPLGELGYSRDKLALGEAAVQAAQRVGDRARAAWHTIYDVGWTHIQRGELEKAKTITEQGLTEAQGAHHLAAICIAQRNLAVIELLLDSPDTAIDHIVRAVTTAEQEDLQSCVALAKATLGEAKLGLGEAAEAFRLLKEVLPVHEQARDASMQSITLSKMARAALAKGDLDQARQCLERAMVCAEGIPDPSRASALALAVNGRLQHELGMMQEARESLEKSLDTYARLGQLLKVREVQQQLDEIAQVAGTTG